MSRMSAVFGGESEDMLMRVMSATLASQRLDGSWGSDDYPIMKACFTAQVLDSLHHAGMSLSTGTSTGPNRRTVQEPVRRAIKWLRSNQHSDGSWGEDAWDTCQVLKVMLKAGYREKDPVTSLGLRFLRNTVTAGWPNKDTYWFGPGFMGAALEVFNGIGDNQYAKVVLDSLWECFDESTASLGLPISDSESPRAPAEWHMANALKGLNSFGSVTAYTRQTTRIVERLKQAQTKEGAWSPGHFEITSFCTFEAVAAISLIEGGHSREAKLGAEWLLKQCALPGQNLSTLLMATGAIVRTRMADLSVSLDFVFAHELLDLISTFSGLTGTLSAQREALSRTLTETWAEKKLVEQQKQAALQKIQEMAVTAERLQDDVDRERGEIAALQKTLESYALRLTGNQLAVLGLALTIVTFIIGVIVSIAVSLGSSDINAR
jgi:hypothetical protein